MTITDSTPSDPIVQPSSKCPPLNASDFTAIDRSLPIRRYKDLTGNTFGKLTVVEYYGRRRHKRGTLIVWLCQCECGNSTLAQSCNLTTGAHASCGCNTSTRNWKRRKTNIRDEQLYHTWWQIIDRTNHHDVYKQRGRCDGFNEFDHFVKVMGPKPHPNFSVDRIDNDGGYWCGVCDECTSLVRTCNVRWADHDTQANNKSNNVRITYKGETLTITQWAKRLGIKRELISNRFHNGWPIEDVFEKPLQRNGHTDTPFHQDDRVRDQAIRDYQAGASLTSLAIKYRSSRHTLSRIFKSRGVTLRSQSDTMKLVLGSKRRLAEARRQLTLFE